MMKSLMKSLVKMEMSKFKHQIYISKKIGMWLSHASNVSPVEKTAIELLIYGGS